MNLILLYFIYFILYSIIGWIIESTFVFLGTKKWVDRGFLIGPYLPIYGWGSILMILYLTQYKDNIITVFILGVVVCSILEYITSYVMEKLFKTRWWDYSNNKFNLNGRICGKNCLLFGVLGVLLIYIIHPLLTNIVNKIPINILNIITIIIFTIFIIDNIISFNVCTKFKKTLTNLDLKKDSTKEFTKTVKETLYNNHKILERRLIKAFPDIIKIIEKKNEINEVTKEKIKGLEKDIKALLKKDN